MIFFTKGEIIMLMLTIFKIPPSILWLAFIVTALCVVYSSIQLSKYVAGISEKTTIGGAFLGAFVFTVFQLIFIFISSNFNDSLRK